MVLKLVSLFGALALLPSPSVAAPSNAPAQMTLSEPTTVQLGPRPYYLVADMASSPLKTILSHCADSLSTFHTSRFTIAHRGGADLQFPEHSLESNVAGARMGAGVLECDVTFTADRALVCRHSQCDLHATTNVVAIPDLNAKCTQSFVPADAATGRPARATCCASDISLAEFKTLCAKMDGVNASATTPEDFLRGTPDWRTELYGACGTTLTLDEHIALAEGLGLAHSPELKTPVVEMPFGGDYTQEMFAQQMVDAYKAAGVSPARVFPQSSRFDDIRYWLSAEPEFGRQAMYLATRSSGALAANLTQLAAQGLRIIAPPVPALLALDEDGAIVPSEYAVAAREAGLEIITWTLERSGRLGRNEGEDYFRSVRPTIRRDGDVYEVLDVLARGVGVRGVFTDWAATTTFYANCVGVHWEW